MIMFDELTSWDNLLLAYGKAARGKRGKPGVAIFEHRLEDNLLQLQRELRQGIYQLGGYVSFTIHDPKRRLISAAPFRDRVVHHALYNMIEPVFERSFIEDSYANRLGKGNHRACDRCQQFARRFRYVLQVDVRQYFPSIDHAILQGLLRRRIEDQRVLALCSQILNSGVGVLGSEYDMFYFPGDDLLAALRPRGLPIGNLTSQFWANVYLNPVDHFIKRELRCRGYVRYVDDLLLFADHKRTMWQWKDRLIERLARLRLTVHPGAHPRPAGEGIPFLGFVIYAQARRLKRGKGVRYQRRFKWLREGYRKGKVGFEEMSASVAGWVNHVRFANTVGLRKAVLSSVVL